MSSALFQNLRVRVSVQDDSIPRKLRHPDAAGGNNRSEIFRTSHSFNSYLMYPETLPMNLIDYVFGVDCPLRPHLGRSAAHER
jgi:hypothetical protein